MTAVAFRNYLGMPIVILGILGPKLRELGVVQGDPVVFLSVLNLTAEALLWVIGGYMLEIQGQVKQEALIDVKKHSELDVDDSESSMTEDENCCPGAGKLALDRVAQVVSYSWEAMKKAFGLVTGLPPVWALAAAMTISLTNPWVGMQTVLTQPKAPLEFAFHGIQAMGMAAVPLNLLVLGSNLSQGIVFDDVSRETCFGIAVAKLVLMPVAMIFVVFVLGQVLPVQRREVWVIALLEACPPTANTVAAMVELSGKNSKGMSAVIAMQYYFAPFTVTAWLTVFTMLLESSWFVPR